MERNQDGAPEMEDAVSDTGASRAEITAIRRKCRAVKECAGALEAEQCFMAFHVPKNKSPRVRPLRRSGMLQQRSNSHAPPREEVAAHDFFPFIAATSLAASVGVIVNPGAIE
jgi:hypothetical protein